MKKVGVIVLSRFNSSRLPGKALKKIEGKEVLTYIIERLSQVFTKEEIVIATSIEKTDEPISDYCRENNIKSYRGSLNNVAERFYKAGLENNFDYSIRINGDNIFVDVDLLKELKNEALKDKYDFITNVKDRTYPKGMSIEIVRLTNYALNLKLIEESENLKEHVTLCYYESLLKNTKYFYKYNTELKGASGIQLALDTQEDFIKTKELINSFTKPHWEYNLEELYKILEIKKYV